MRLYKRLSAFSCHHARLTHAHTYKQTHTHPNTCTPKHSHTWKHTHTPKHEIKPFEVINFQWFYVVYLGLALSSLADISTQQIRLPPF